MRVLICHNFYRYIGGEDISVRVQVDLLAAQGHEVMTLFRDSRDIEGFSLLDKVLLPVSSVYSPSARHDVQTLLNRSKPDVAHIHNLFPLLSPSILAPLRDRGIPVIMTLHNFFTICPNGIFFTRGRVCERCGKWAYHWALLRNCRNDLSQSLTYTMRTMFLRQQRVLENSVDLFIAPSAFAKDKLVTYGFSPQKVVHLPPPILEPSDGSSMSDSQGYIAYVGRLAPEKGLWTLVKAVGLVKNCKLKIAGDGPLRESLAAFVERERIEGVDFVGHLSGESLTGFIAGASCVVVPSEWYETGGRAAMEAMSLGKVVIASRIGALREVVDDGVNGYLFQPGNAVDLAEKISNLLSDPRRAVDFGLNSRQKFEDCYSPAIFYANLMTIHRQLVP